MNKLHACLKDDKITEFLSPDFNYEDTVRCKCAADLCDGVLGY